jgi:hypothetical protein
MGRTWVEQLPPRTRPSPSHGQAQQANGADQLRPGSSAWELHRDPCELHRGRCGPSDCSRGLCRRADKGRRQSGGSAAAAVERRARSCPGELCGRAINKSNPAKKAKSKFPQSPDTYKNARGTSLSREEIRDDRLSQRESSWAEQGIPPCPLTCSHARSCRRHRKWRAEAANLVTPHPPANRWGAPQPAAPFAPCGSTDLECTDHVTLHPTRPFAAANVTRLWLAVASASPARGKRSKSPSR